MCHAGKANVGRCKSRAVETREQSVSTVHTTKHRNTTFLIHNSYVKTCVQAGHQIAHRAMTRVNGSVPKQYNTDNAYMNKICCRQAPTHDHSITVCVIVKLGLMTCTDSVGATNVMGRRRNASYNAFKGNLSSNWATFPCTSV